MKRTVLIEISFHLGELYFLMPFLYSIERDKSIKFIFVFTRKDVYKQFVKDKLLLEAMRHLDAEIHKIYFERFQRVPGDTMYARFIAEMNRKHRKKTYFKKKIEAFLNDSDYCLSQLSGSRIPKVAAKLGEFKARIIKYPHTSGPTIYDANEAKKQSLKQLGSAEDVLLILDSDAIPFYKLMGFSKFIALGYHSVEDAWIKFVKNFNKRSKPYALIFSYRAREDVLPAAKWEALHQSTYKSIREVFGDMPIVLKPHPYQKLNELKKLFRKYRWENVQLTTENPMSLAVGANFGVGFLTSGVYNTLMLNIPSINYFNAREDYIASFGCYKQNYTALGIPDVQTEKEFCLALEKIKSGEMQTTFGSVKKAIPRLKSFKQLEDKLTESTIQNLHEGLKAV